MSLNIKGNIITSGDTTNVGVFKTKVNRDGLVCYLDAGNLDSYPTTGTTWYDLSGNGNNGTIYGGTTFSSSNSGILVLDTTGYITTGLNFSSSNFTVMGAARYSGANRGRIITCNVNNWLLGWWSSSTENYYAEGWITPSSQGANDTNWRIVAGTGHINDDTYSMFVNGTLTYTSSGGSQGPNGLGINVYSEKSDIEISYLLVYNRNLNPYEIAENFQATRGRFGL